MCECFNMAYQDNTNALQLHIKINSENLLPVPQKYNAGSLRIPADPSWPKIPQRKLVDDIGDAIEPPCIVTLTGTPRRSRTVVQTPLNQSPKSTITTKDSAYSSFCHQKITPSMHTLKRPPGYTDPRFKKVTNTKRNQITSTEILQKETNQPNNTIYTENIYGKDMENEVTARNFNTEQTKVSEAEKPHEEEKIESAQNHKKNDKFNDNQEPFLQQNQSIIDSKSNKRNNTTECDNISKNDIFMKDAHSSKYTSKLMVNDANNQVNIATLPVQENNGQLFFILDKKLQTQPLNAIHIPKEYVNQCYNVQVPVLTYQSIPMQVAPPETNNMQQCLNQLEYKNANEIPSLTKKESEQHVHLNKTQHINKSLIDDPEEKGICERGSKLSVQSNLFKENRKNCFTPDPTENLIISKKSQNSNRQWKQQETDSEYYIPNLNKKDVHNNVLQNLKMKKIACDTSGEETTDSEYIMQQTTEKKEFIDANKFIAKSNRISSNAVHGDIKTSIQSHDQINSLLKEDNYLQSAQKSNMIITNQNQPTYQDLKTVINKTKGKNKSEQNLFCTKSQYTKKLCRNSEPYITFKQKKASAKFSRKARTYFQKNSHSALVDSDYTLVWPNCQYSKYKHNKTNIHKFGNHKLKKISPHFNSIPMHERNMSEQIDVSNFDEQNYLKNEDRIDSCPEITKSLSSIKDRCKCETSPRSNPDNVCNTLKGISPKTQELLNKSYWEYYNKLRHKIKNTSSMEQQYPYHLTIDAFDKRNKRNGNEELRNQLKVNPEFQTLQQCTALSTMINKALDSNLQSDFVQTRQLYMNDNMKSSSNHKIGKRNSSAKKIPILANAEHAFNKIKYTDDKINDKQFLELKSIMFFSGMMYILIIFLPMLYDYFYYEEYDEYENWTYLELVMEYILSSFKEAFGGIFNGMKQVFFYPVSL